MEGLKGRGLGLCDLFTYSGTFGVKTNEAEVSLKQIPFFLCRHIFNSYNWHFFVFVCLFFPRKISTKQFCDPVSCT